jgi:ABC-2 type transport system permease protein
VCHGPFWCEIFVTTPAIKSASFFVSLASAFGSAAAPYLSGYGGNYFAFVLIGVAFSEYLAIGIGAIGDSIRQGQTTGTLELMLLSPTRLVVTLLSSSLWSYMFATLRVVVYLIVGVGLGMRFDQANVPFAVLSLVLAIISFNALGLFSASVIILMKRGDPLGWALRVSSLVLGGVYYPVAVLPDWLNVIGQLLPLTHALELLRRSLLRGEGFAQLWGELAILAGLTLVLLPLALLACQLAIRVARTDGSLSHY